MIVVLCFQLGCGSDDVVDPNIESSDNSLKIENGNRFEIIDEVNLTSMYESEVRNLEPNTEMNLITVIQGTDKVSIDVKYIGMREFNLGFPVYEFELTNSLLEEMGGIAAGMSGSPVGPEGRVIGALAYGDIFGTSPYRFWVASIDGMEEAKDNPAFGEFLDLPGAPSIHVRQSPIKSPFVISGINGNNAKNLINRLNSSNRLNSIEFVNDIGGEFANAPTTSDELEPGDMIGVAVADGDVVDIFAYGTVTQVYPDGKFLAFGHSLQYDGMVSIPVYKAIASGIVSNLQSSYKSVTHYGQPIGTLTKDLSAAVVGELGDAPDTIPVHVSYHPVNSKDPIETLTKVAYGQEWSIPLVVSLTADSLRREYTNGTSAGKIVFEFEETKQTYTQKWRNISDNPFFDTYENVEYAILQIVDSINNITAKATLKSVHVELVDKPEIASAEIIELEIPDDIKAGSKSTFKITLLPHWSIIKNDDRTITEEISIDIPVDFELDFSTVIVRSENVDLFDLTYDFDYDFDIGISLDEEDESLETLEDLIDKMESDIPDPGTIKLIIKPDDILSDHIESDIIIGEYVVDGRVTDIIFLD